MNNIYETIITGSTIQVVFFIIIPLIFLVVNSIKKILPQRIFWLGVVSFFVSQIILRMPIMGVLSLSAGFTKFSTTILGIFILGGLSAGLFEESGRLFFGRTLRAHGAKNAVAFGLGHGLMEVAVLALGSLSNLVMASMMMESPDMVIAIVGEEMFAELSDVFASAGGVEVFILAIVERILVVTIHIGLTFLVFKGIREKKNLWYFVAVLAHTLLNGFSALVGMYNLYLSEVVVLVFAVGAVFFIGSEWKKEKTLREELEKLRAEEEEKSREIFT